VSRSKNARTHGASRGLGNSRARILAGAAALGVAALAAPASALAVANEPPALPHSIISFPQRDFVSAGGFDQADRVVVSLLRNGVTIGTSGEITPQDDPTTPAFEGLVEVNHPGGGCWTTTTPDILPGDIVRTTIVGTAIEDQTTTANVTADAPTSPSPDTITVTGTAQDAAGNPLPLAQIEQRLVSAGNLFDANGRRTLRASAGADGTLAYDVAGSTHFTATYTGLSPADVLRALSAESRSLWLGSIPGSGAELTIYENPVTGGPAPPCNAPPAVNAVTSTDHLYKGLPTINRANVGTPVVLSGLAQADASGVSVQIGDAIGGTTSIQPAVLTSGVNGKTWTATIPASQVGALLDGTLTASATFNVPGGPIGGSMLTLRKDTATPAAPGASPGAGTYPAAQMVTLTGAAAIHYTTDGSDPSDVTTLVTGQVGITTSLTLRAISIDPVGNTSAIKDFAYVISPPVVTPPAGGGTPTGGASGTPAATGTGTAVAAVIASSRPALGLLQLGIAPRIKQRKAQKSGLRVIMRLSTGTKVVRIRVYRRSKGGLTLLSAGFRAPSSAGLYRASLSFAGLRRQLRKGTYEIQVTPGYGKTDLGRTSKATFKVV